MAMEILRGWDEIEAVFPIFEPRTIRRKYGKEMLEKGYVFKSRIGSGRGRCLVWSFPNLVIAYIAGKQADQGFV